MINFNYFFFNLFFKEFLKFNNNKFFISLGYRAAPIIISAILVGKRKNIFSYDERSLGFFALGNSKIKNIPSIIIVTSGTALANLFPSIIEAYYSFSKLLILSSDRVIQKKDCGENQTIDQTKIYGIYIKKYFDLNVENFYFYNLKYLISTLRYAYQYCFTPIQGSVHLNFYISEPLYPVYYNNSFFDKYCDNYFFNKKIKKYKFSYERSNFFLFSNNEYLYLIEILKKSKFGLIIVSKMTDSFKEKIQDFLKFVSFPVLIDLSSNINYFNDVNFINVFSLKFKSFCPDLIIFIGEKNLEKNLLNFIDLCNVKQYISFYDKITRVDNIISSNLFFYINFDNFVSFLYKYKNYNFNIKKSFFSFFNLHLILDKLIFQNKNLNDFFIYKIFSYNIKKNNNVFISNSLCIRIFNLCWLNYSCKSNTYFNRGANGIDGLISTALGIACSIKNSFFFFIGDISFLHDINGLFFLRFIFSNIFIHLINNNGCGIFSLLPIFNKKNFFFPYFEFNHYIKKFNFYEIFFLYEKKINNKKKYLFFFYCNLKNNRVNFPVLDLKNNYNYFFLNLLNKYIKFYFFKDF